MWLYSMVVTGELIEDAEMIQGWSIAAHTGPIDPPRDLLVHLVADEDESHQETYRSITIFGVHLERAQRSGHIYLTPLLEPTVNEQNTIRTWLIRKRWPAWARADHALRRILGAPEPPVLLAEAARHWAIPLQTLAKAAVEERLPTILAGDRRMVYLATIAEAQAHRQLHYRPGRPVRGA